MTLKSYLNINGDKPWQIHYRSAGNDLESERQPIVLLHPSPLSSTFMQPIINLLSCSYSVYAWDMPGYGQSDSLPEVGAGLAGYVEALEQFINGLGLKDPIIYGSATGAQIAIEYAKAHENNLRGLVLENAASFTEEERDNIMKNYFPNIAPQQDGSHLQLVWKIVNQLYHFFPWFDTSEKARIGSATIPAELLQRTLMDYFNAGENYPIAYKAAFENERPEQLQPVTVPTKILNWQSGMLKDYVARLKSANLPENVEILDVPADLDSRFAALKSSIHALSQYSGS